jgi:hypothetical protein
MPPKIRNEPVATTTSTSIDELVATVKSLTSVTEALKVQLSASTTTTISDLSRRLETIEGLLHSTQKENADLKTDLSNSYDEVKTLKTKLNNLEQHHHSWSIRVVGVKFQQPMRLTTRLSKTTSTPSWSDPSWLGPSRRASLPQSHQQRRSWRELTSCQPRNKAPSQSLQDSTAERSGPWFSR